MNEFELHLERCYMNLGIARKCLSGSYKLGIRRRSIYHANRFVDSAIRHLDSALEIQNVGNVN